MKPIPARYHRISAWRGYPIPGTALIGGSYTGEAPDSPAKLDDLSTEIKRFRNEVLRPLGIKSRLRWGVTSNVFCAKRWLCVSPQDFHLARTAALHWLAVHDQELRVLHDAELDQAKEA